MSFEEFLGKAETVEDEVSAAWLHNAAAVIGTDVPDDASVPSLWHWMLFRGWPKGLRADGGTVGEGFLPPLGHLPRRMGAGGRLTFHQPLRVGDRVSRTSRIHAIADKVGRDGPLVLLTLAHEIRADGDLAMSEEQDLIYLAHSPERGDPVRSTVQEPPDGLRQTCRCDALTLFRYSALTGNSHRIHYDQDFVRKTEGFPGLVVHGPLQATWLAATASGFERGRRLESLRYRHVGAAYHTDGLEACAWREGDGLKLALRTADGRRCTEAAATLA